MRARLVAPTLLILGALRLGAASASTDDRRGPGASSLRGHPSRGLQHFFEPFGVNAPEAPGTPDTVAPVTKEPSPTRAPVTKAPKGSKEPKETRAPTTSHPTRAPPPSKAPAFKSTKAPCNSTDPGPKGCDDSQEIDNYGKRRARLD